MAYCHRSFLFASRRTAARRVLIDRRARPQLEIDCPRSYRLTTKLLNSRDDHAKERKGEKRKYGIRWTARWLEGKFWREFCFLRPRRLDRGAIVKANLCWFMIVRFFSGRNFRNVRDWGKFFFFRVFNLLGCRWYRKFSYLRYTGFRISI